MTTEIRQTTRAVGALTGEPQFERFGSLAALTETLSELRRPPTLEELEGWLQTLRVEADELRPYVSFKEWTYARHRVFRNEWVELLVLCWRPGQRTPIHDHNGSYGVVCVHEGVMWETLFTLDAEGLSYQTARELTGGQLTGADVPDIHQLGNPDVSGRNLVTLHLYAPPLKTINTYRIGRTEQTGTLCLNSWNPTI
ncbi:MAG TPA: cysteine dioxygenase family protein [Pyrinomonadaceae bacterium]|nr:cysteine dioxygenase family protein [Pyrinomonadaceae bacterium]